MVFRRCYFGLSLAIRTTVIRPAIRNVELINRGFRSVAVLESNSLEFLLHWRPMKEVVRILAIGALGIAAVWWYLTPASLRNLFGGSVRFVIKDTNTQQQNERERCCR